MNHSSNMKLPSSFLLLTNPWMLAKPLVRQSFLPSAKLVLRTPRQELKIIWTRFCPLKRQSTTTNYGYVTSQEPPPHQSMLKISQTTWKRDFPVWEQETAVSALYAKNCSHNVSTSWSDKLPSTALNVDTSWSEFVTNLECINKLYRTCTKVQLHMEWKKL